MQQITLTYRQWMDVHPSFRSMVDRVPHVVVYDDGELVVRRVVFERPPCSMPAARPCAGQLRLRGA